LLDELKLKDSLFCLNEKDIKGKPINYNLFGRDEVSKHRRLDIIFKPCMPKQLTKENGHLEKVECLVDLKDKKKVE
jgi:hypothetical protein